MPTSQYEVRNELTDEVFVSGVTPEQADSEVERLNGETDRNNIKHLGQPVTFAAVEVVLPDPPVEEEPENG